jgi:hypothetical protein
MATIKYNIDEGGNKRIVLKDKKVSCECCFQGCCWYPATKLADGSYSAGNLPLTIRFYGQVISKISGQAAYGTTENGVRFENDLWTVYRNGKSSTRPCLFFGESGFIDDNNSIEDNFEDVYEAYVYSGTVPPDFTYETVSIYRISYKLWIGNLSCGELIGLVYQPCFFEPPGAKIFGENSAPFWSLTWNFCKIPPIGTPGTTLSRLGTPEGFYSNTSVEVRIP